MVVYYYKDSNILSNLVPPGNMQLSKWLLKFHYKLCLLNILLLQVPSITFYT